MAAASVDHRNNQHRVMRLLNLPPIEEPPPLVEGLSVLALSIALNRPANPSPVGLASYQLFADAKALPRGEASANKARDLDSAEILPFDQPPAAGSAGDGVGNPSLQQSGLAEPPALLPTLYQLQSFERQSLELGMSGRAADWYKLTAFNAGSRIQKQLPQPATGASAKPANVDSFVVELSASLGPGPEGSPLYPLPIRKMQDWQRPTEASAIRLESVSHWLVPARPVNPAWNGELRRFDWAQLIARLADFQTSRHEVKTPAAATASTTAQHEKASTYRLGAAERAKKHGFLASAAAFWNSQTWPVRALALALPLLAFAAAKPALDGSLSEPVVLAKDLPPASSTALRRMPSRDRVNPAPVASPIPSAGAVPPVNAAKTDLPPIATVEPRLTNVDRMLVARAAVELADDFSYGLDSWDANTANATSWTYDPTGFIRPRSLALYRPSMNLTNYTVEFLAKIDSNAIGWVVRAVDHNNYHAIKLVQRGGGPLPRYTIVRYSVVDGREGPRIEHPLPLNLYKDTLFRIRMDIRGANYSILVQDSVVDSWTNDRFEFGGVGFFSGRGEESRVRWLQVTYQNDLLGKICAWLAPKSST